MANYISSNGNRFYVATESAYGAPAPIGPSNRFPAVRLQCHQALKTIRRRDKTGARTYLGSSPNATHVSHFEMNGYLTSWNPAIAPYYGPLIQAAMGEATELVQGLIVAAASGVQIQTQDPHNLGVGAAVASGGEIRFVTTVLDSSTINVNVPFSVTPGPEATLATTSGFRLAAQLPSLSIYDYWDPANGVSRLITGAGVDRFRIEVRGDTHEMSFGGPAADVLDSCSGVFGVSGIGSFPSEPPLSLLDYSIVPGQLGEVWLGSPLDRVFTLTEAAVEIRNNLLARDQDFGASYPSGLVPGPREVVASFTLIAQADANTTNLYAAAKARTPISAMLQLGQQPGQILAVHLPNVVPELPFYEDSEPYLLWEFKNNLAQGVSNDEAYVAFA
jgi:hypothetical protein